MTIPQKLADKWKSEHVTILQMANQILESSEPDAKKILRILKHLLLIHLNTEDLLLYVKEVKRGKIRTPELYDSRDTEHHKTMEKIIDMYKFGEQVIYSMNKSFLLEGREFRECLTCVVELIKKRIQFEEDTWL